MASDQNPDPREVVSRALSEMQRGNAASALDMLNAAAQAHPTNPELRLQQAAALRLLGRLPDALDAIDAALAIDPNDFLALLSKGAVYERLGRSRSAAFTYRNALRLAPPPQRTPPALEAPIRRAREVVAAEANALTSFLHDAVGAVRARHGDATLDRFDECLDIYAGAKRNHLSQPIDMQVPQLPAIPFFPREEFPWLPDLEAATDTIRTELSALVDAGMPDFAPYIAYAPGTPVNQFGALNHSRDWSSYWLWRDGKREESAIARCPKTASILEALPMADQPGFAPTALFSALAPRTRIPPHTGSTNARLLVHLPLVLPGSAGFRVGNVVRQWRMGEAWVFDDTIEHEAWNDADQTRIILIFDIWNPLLSVAERELISEMMLARNRWYAEQI